MSLPTCRRCGLPCVQCTFEVQPGIHACFDCVTDDEMLACLPSNPYEPGSTSLGARSGDATQVAKTPPAMESDSQPGLLQPLPDGSYPPLSVALLPLDDDTPAWVDFKGEALRRREDDA